MTTRARYLLTSQNSRRYGSLVQQELLSDQIRDEMINCCSGRRSSSATLLRRLAVCICALAATACLRPYSASLLDLPKAHEAKLNFELKSTLLNDCPSDAVIYAGYRGAEIQTALQNAICAALDRTTSNADSYFGCVENHYPAHTAYSQNADALRLLFGGSARTNPP
jgi:hypothetical protein